MTERRTSLEDDGAVVETPAVRSTSRPGPAVFYGWRIVAAAFVSQAIVWGFRIHLFGLFLSAINEERGWSPALTAAVYSVSLLCNSLLGPLVGRVVDRRGPKTVMLPGAAISILGLILLSQIQEVWQFYATYGVIYAIGETMGGGVPAGTVISKWFVRRRGTALGIVAMASNVGGFVMLPLCSLVIASWGWRVSTLVPAGFIALLAVPSVALVMRRTPEDMGLRPDGDPAQSRPAAAGQASEVPPAGRDWSLGEAARTTAFWSLGISWGLSLAGGLTYATYVFSFLGEAGVPASTVAGALSVVLFLALPTRFLYGWLSDRLDKRLVIVTYEAGIMAAYLSLTQLNRPLMVYVSLVFYAFSVGALQSVPQNMAADLFGRRSVGALLGMLTLISTLIVVAAIPLTGLVRQQSGGYTPIFYAFPVVLVASMLVIYFARHAAHPGLDRREIAS